MERLTDAGWRNLDPWECCVDDWCYDRACRFDDECRQKCNTMKLYRCLAEYEDTGLEPERIETMKKVVAALDFAQAIRTVINLISSLLETRNAEEDNAPLTLEDSLRLDELRVMDGEPVWVINSEAKRKAGFNDEWALVSVSRESAESISAIYNFEAYYNTWMAYRHKPEGKSQSGGDASGSSDGACR